VLIAFTLNPVSPPPYDEDIYWWQRTSDQPPVFYPSSTADRTALCGEDFILPLAATDSEGESISYQAAMLPAGMTLTGNALRWVPPANAAGATHYVVIRAVDNHFGADTRVVKVTVSGTCGGGELAVPPGAALPTDYALYPIGPNPFNAEARIRFDVPTATRVRIGVYDLQGRVVRTVVDRELAAGAYDMPLRARDAAGELATGIYFVRMDSATFTARRTVVRLP
jgi:hypothetical protein